MGKAGALRRVMTVDPGISDLGSTGCAYWPILRGRPEQTTLLRCPPDSGLAGKSWHKRSLEIGREFGEVLRIWKPLRVYVEFPQLWGDSAKSLASGTRGDILKLAFHVGVLAREIGANGATLYPLLVNTWKGQLQKSAVDARTLRRLGRAYPNHISDAVGMGLHLMGEL